MDPTEDLTYGCPYCGKENSIRIDRSGGKNQYMVTDCEVCCRPISVEIQIDEDGYVNLTAKREGEG